VQIQSYRIREVPVEIDPMTSGSAQEKTTEAIHGRSFVSFLDPDRQERLGSLSDIGHLPIQNIDSSARDHFLR
jgi:hypothetical protein